MILAERADTDGMVLYISKVATSTLVLEISNTEIKRKKRALLISNVMCFCRSPSYAVVIFYERRRTAGRAMSF